MKLPFPERVLHQHMATLGKTGAGKSSAMRVVAEHLLDKNRRVAIVDPKGDWWGLKSSADGKSAGYPVITFGNFKEPRATDVAINEHSGAHVAELIAKGNRPCVIGFRGWMPGQLVKFWIAFAPTLFNANEGELNVFIDEIHNFAPKGKIFDPDAGKCLHWTNRIMSEGRGLGLTFFIASQRPQKVHNDTLDNCETLVAMRVAHPAAREALKDWIDGNGDPAKGKEVLATLAQLKRGEAWVWSPENDFGPERVQFPMFQTFDSFAPPQLQKKVSQSGWSEVDLDQVKQKLATVIAEAEANDPKKLKSEIARLRQELAKKPAAAPPSTIQEKIVEVPAIGENDREMIRKFIGTMEEMATKIDGFSHDLKSVAISIHQGIQAAAKRPQPSSVKPIETKRPSPLSVAVKSAVSTNASGELSKGERTVLAAIAQDGTGVDRAQLTIVTGYKRSTRDAYLQRLGQKGFITENGNGIKPTDEGIAALGADYELLPTGDSLREHWLTKLPEGERRILRILSERWPNAVDRGAISEMTGYARSSRDAYIQRLSARKLVDASGREGVKASDLLFDTGAA